MSDGYVNNIDAVAHVESLDRQRWKIKRRAGDYLYRKFHAADGHEAFWMLCRELGLTAEMGSATYQTAQCETVFLSRSYSELVTAYHADRDADVRRLIASVRPPKPEASIKWWYMPHQGGPEHIEMPLTGHDPVDAFYPWMPKTIATFADEFARSEANVLLLIGKPGTGKTSFIRGLIRRMRYETWVTYDPVVQKNEQFYVQFASVESNQAPRAGRCAPVPEEEDYGAERVADAEHARTSDGRCLVMEDADELLGKRSDGNDLMKRMLNVSDGIVSLPSRKIIFSSNLPGLQSIDDALLRPGRCFGAVKFRELTRAEGASACAAVGLTLRSAEERMTLSQALNGHQAQLEVQTIGFSAR